MLKWEEVVEYTFLSEFDLLRQSCREDISVRPWATPAGCMALDQFFKEKQARTEIQRLNIEIKRFVTAIHDEDQHLHSVQAKLQSDPILAFHVTEYRHHRTRFNGVHLARLSKLRALAGFTGSLKPGEALRPYGNAVQSPSPGPMNTRQGVLDDEEEESDEEGDHYAGEEIVGALLVAADPLGTSSEVVLDVF